MRVLDCWQQWLLGLGKRRPVLLAMWLLSQSGWMLFSHGVAAEAYRSKLYLDPNKQLSETADLSLQALEKQINSITDAYTKSTTGRYLAHHYVKQKEYGKAIEFYNLALEAEGLSAVVNQELLKELASVYVLQQQYEHAVTTLNRLQMLDLGSQLLLAQSYFGVQDYLATVETLDKIPLTDAELTEQQLNQMLALYYKAGSYPQSQRVLQRLIDLYPQTFKYWRQLTSILLAQNKQRPALDHLALARHKKLPFELEDILLLADLYVANQAAAKGARVLEQAVLAGEIKRDESVIKRTFEYWLQAREKEKAVNTLEQSIDQIEDFDLFIRLAQLQMEQSDWKPMNTTMLTACKNVLKDRYVSQANLLLGISELKLGNKVSARRSFINATLLGGRGEKAKQWLDFMDAEPATDDERSEITGPCQPRDSKVRYAKTSRSPKVDIEMVAVANNDPTVANDEHVIGSVNTKTVEAQSLYGLNLTVKAEEIAASIKKNAFRAGVALVKSGGTINGPLHILFEGGASGEALTEGEPLNFRLAFPYKGKPRNKGSYRAKKAPAFKCAYLTFNGTAEETPAAWGSLIKRAIAAGYTPTGESRMILTMNASDPTAEPAYELQLGIQ
ncbi:hypothetical protein [Alkalimarinus sediminis]|uniref:Tetratricopeptide repeat protein n=1 Tax=Alkalimarinus sediminis TaxID=1632866 RepID=A0A9E8HIE9_9ALTE|nr:hypothetical protein [Alkalimarinus sediminis]UZW74935.1 hypothetical protein NNL22_18235 [Alkalimarinus sediminis]